MQDLEQLAGLESAPHKVRSSVGLLVVGKAVVVGLVGRHHSSLDLNVCFDLPFDLPTNLLPHWVSVSHLTLLHPHVGLHRLEQCLSAHIPYLIPLQLQVRERLIAFLDVLSDCHGSIVANLVPSEVELLH